MSNDELYDWPVPLLEPFVRAVTAFAGKRWSERNLVFDHGEPLPRPRGDARGSRR